MSKRIDVVLSSHYSDLMERYEELKSKYRRMEKEYKELQVEHSRMLFDMDAVIEYEVDVKCKKLTLKLENENAKLKETIKDHQLYEEKLEHRIIEFEELLHWD